MALAQPALSHEDKIVAPADEIAGGQLFHLHAVEELGIELSVERLQADRLAKLRISNPRFRAPLAPSLRGTEEQAIDQLQM